MKRIGMLCLRWSLRGAAICMGVVAMFAVVVILATLGDGMFMATAVPSLTSVRTNRYEMGRHAITMVIDAIEGRRPAEPVIDLGFQLMVRESSMPQTG